MKKSFEVRKIKLQARYYCAQQRLGKIVPSLYMSGIWLEKAGFQSRDIVTVTVKRNCLIIRKYKSYNNIKTRSKPLKTNVMCIKTKPKNERMFMRSIEFIRNNPNITTNHLPDNLIKYWIVPKFTTNMEYKISDDQILIFMYVVGLNKMPKRKIERFLRSYRFNQLFFSFQIILAATKHGRKANIRLEPFPIFDIERYIIPDLNVPEMLIKQYNSIVVKSMMRKI